ncbi:hypothetical protein [Salmonella enterica]|uniref:hypothetical protein n=1 Tax=Salmonella enterica TaxID=28901 RepID=UPI003F4E2226
MTIDKQALRISELEELNELLREKVKKLESDLWDKEQLRHVYSEKSFDLQCKVRELGRGLSTYQNAALMRSCT